MLITKTENHIILEKETEREIFYLGKLAGITTNGNLVTDAGNTYRLIIPEKDFTNTLIALLDKS